MSFVEPRTGPCASWITAADVLSAPVIEQAEVTVPPDIAGLMAAAATEVCYNLSAKQFTGVCGPVTIRPLARPVDVDTRFGRRQAPGGYLSASQSAAGLGQQYAGAVTAYGTSRPPEIDLGAYPVLEVTQVKIDGVIIPPNEYKLQDRRTLVRMRPSAGATPTERYGWPVNQVLDLPDTEPGTFSVSYMYGSPPPRSGVLACISLAAQLTLNFLGRENSLPQRVTSVSRQGVSVNVADVADMLKSGLSGIYEVDVFVEAFNPTKAKMRPLVWSPDLGRPRRS